MKRRPEGRLGSPEVSVWGELTIQPREDSSKGWKTVNFETRLQGSNLGPSAGPASSTRSATELRRGLSWLGGLGSNQRPIG